MNIMLPLIIALAALILLMMAGIHQDQAPVTRLRMALIDAAAFTILVLAIGALL